MAWDRDAYRRHVLEPARQAGSVPVADLYQRYGLPAGAADEDAVARQVVQAVAYWRELRSDLRFRTLAGRLLIAHEELVRAGPLTADRLAQLHQQHREQLRDRLAGYTTALASEQAIAGPGTVARLSSTLGGSVPNAEVVAALRDAGITVVDAFPVLPATPHPQLQILRPYLDDLGLQLSAEVIFGADVRRGFRVLGGFRLTDGRRLDAVALSRAQLDADRQAYVGTATDRVQKALTSMRTVVGMTGGLDALAVSEVVERLRQLIRSGLSGQRCLARRALELGLASDEANLIAETLRAGDTTAALRQQIDEMLRAGQLRAAQRLAAGLASGDPLLTRVNGVDDRVDELSRAAAAAAARGETEQAAQQLAEAIGLARDDDVLAGRLAALPPPAPGAAHAQLDGHQMLISWEPSPAQAGRVRYLVVRGLGRAPVSATDGTVVVPGTEARSVTDRDAPAGAEIGYSVFAERGGAVYSARASTELFLFAPDVTDVDVAEAEFSVTVSWLAHPGAAGIDVVRWARGAGQEHDAAAAADGTAVAASMRGFTDDGLRTGTEYQYRITAVYRAPDGARRRSAGIVVPAVPTPEPGPVSDLTVALATDEVPADGAAAPTAPVVLSWTPPRHGQVRLVRAGHPPGWLAGARVTPDPDTLTGIPGQPEHDADGRAVLRARLPFGRHCITALTELGRITVAGHPVPLLLLEPARDAHAERRHDTVQLSWVWPRDATDVVIRHPGGELGCSRRAYFDEGGCTISVPRHAVTFSIIAVHQGPDGRQTAPPAVVSLPARPVAVRYHIRRNRLHPRQRVVEVSAEEDVQLPALVTVQTTGRLPPTGPAGGARIHETGGQPAGPAQLVPFTVQLAHRDPGWIACFVDPLRRDPAADPILLFAPPADELRVP